MKTIILRFSLFIVIILFGKYVIAQQEITVIDSSADGTIKFAKVHSPAKTIQSENPKSFLKRILKASPGTEFYLYRVVKDELGMIHEKYQQTYKGIKIEFSEFIIHKDKSGNIIYINGDFAKIPESFNTNPKLEFNEAMTKGAKKYKILNLPDEKSTETPITRRDGNHEVVIIKDIENQYHLAYKVNLEGESIYDSFYGYSDCESGEIIFKNKLVYHSNNPGTAETLYSDNRTITTDSYSGGFRLREVSRGGTSTSIQTYNFNRLPATTISEVDYGMAIATDFSDNDNNWTN